MEGTTNLWDTKMIDFTAGDAVKTTFVLPIALMGGVFVAGTALSLVGKITGKFRKSETPTNES